MTWLDVFWIFWAIIFLTVPLVLLKEAVAREGVSVHSSSPFAEGCTPSRDRAPRPASGGLGVTAGTLRGHPPASPAGSRQLLWLIDVKRYTKGTNGKTNECRRQRL